MSIRNWRPQSQLTTTVRLTEQAARSLSEWLAVQPLPPRTANEALNMALESLAALPVPSEVAALRAACGRLSSELVAMQDRLRLARVEIDMIDDKATSRAVGPAGDLAAQERAA